MSMARGPRRAGGQMLVQPQHPGDEDLALFFLEHHRLLRRNDGARHQAEGRCRPRSGWW